MSLTLIEIALCCQLFENEGGCESAIKGDLLFHPLQEIHLRLLQVLQYNLAQVINLVRARAIGSNMRQQSIEALEVQHQAAI